MYFVSQVSSDNEVIHVRNPLVELSVVELVVRWHTESSVSAFDTCQLVCFCLNN